MKWYKHDPDAFASGTAELTLEETGAYILIIDALYARDGNVPNDDHFISRLLRCRPQVWRRVRDSLIAKGKLHLKTDGKLTANRVETELQTAGKLIANMAELGRVSAEKRRQNNDTTPTGPLVTTTSTTTTREEERAKALSPRRKPRTQLPSDWKPDLEFSEQPEFDKFCDHARAQGRLCADWPAAWRNWKRRAPEFTPRNGSWKDERQKENYDVSKQLREYLRAGPDGPRQGGDAGEPPAWSLPLAQPTRR